MNISESSIGDAGYKITFVTKSSEKTIIGLKRLRLDGQSKINIIFNNKNINQMSLNNATTYYSDSKLYPKHLDNNVDYILVYGHMGFGYYLDTSSIQIQEDREEDKKSYKQWAAKVLYTGIKEDWSHGNIEFIDFKFYIRKGIPFVDHEGNLQIINLYDTKGSNELLHNTFKNSYFYAFDLWI